MAMLPSRRRLGGDYDSELLGADQRSQRPPGNMMPPNPGALVPMPIEMAGGEKPMGQGAAINPMNADLYLDSMTGMMPRKRRLGGML